MPRILMMTKKRKPRAKSGPSQKEFVAAWLASASIAEVAEKTNMTPANIMARASYYRNQGIQLPQFKRGRRKDESMLEETNVLLNRYAIIQEILHLL